LKTERTNLLSDEKTLARFIREILLRPDTPSLIQLVAGNGDYLILSSHIVNATPENKRDFFERLMRACRSHHVEFRRLQEKLEPVARSLGLAAHHSTQIDYYDILGVTSETDPIGIRRAFREKVYEVHPDTGSLGQEGSQAFVELHTAYQTLSDPTLRKQYDQSRQELGTWIETPNPNQSRRATNRYYYQIGCLLILLIIATFIFDFLYRQNALTGGYNAEKEGRFSTTKAHNTLSPRNENTNAMGTAAMNIGAARGTIAETPIEITDALQKNNATAKEKINSTGAMNERHGMGESTSGSLNSSEADLERTHDKTGLSKHTVYLYYAQDKDSGIVEKLADFLRRKGHAALRIQKQTHQNRGIRYFFDEDKDIALCLQSHVHDFLINFTHMKNTAVQIRNLYGVFPDTRKGSLELWIDSLNPESSGFEPAQS
jgi:curved DNA-binding protein CbpA